MFRSSPETSRSHFNGAAEDWVQSSVVLLWTPANQLTWFNTQSPHVEAGVAQCSPNLYCIDRFTHMQREMEGGRTRRLAVWAEWLGLNLDLRGKIKWLFYFYSITSLKFKGAGWKDVESKRGRERLTQRVLSCEPSSSLWHRKWACILLSLSQHSRRMGGELIHLAFMPVCSLFVFLFSYTPALSFSSSSTGQKHFVC